MLFCAVHFYIDQLIFGEFHKFVLEEFLLVIFIFKIHFGYSSIQTISHYAIEWL